MNTELTNSEQDVLNQLSGNDKGFLNQVAMVIAKSGADPETLTMDDMLAAMESVQNRTEELSKNEDFKQALCESTYNTIIN